ncbi:unnamed protein product [Pelagomonas calceolata]|uniref:Calmodulin n=1 Tax=Pelagomonas calceolata TaxID=35677 RepID=A0A8J2SY95_9STRA|nr:unnamed protein product [Pelagomonas calceolata]
MMGPPPMQSADSNEDAASLHAQISALKVMRRRMKAFRRRKRQRVEEPEDDVSLITAESIRETGASLYSASRIEDRLPPRLLEVCYDARTEGSAGPRAPLSLQRLHFAADHATGEPIRRLIMGPWRRDASQLRRVVASCDRLELLDLAPCIPRYGRVETVWPSSRAATTDHNGPDDYALSVLAMATRERIDGLRPLKLKALGLARCVNASSDGIGYCIRELLSTLERVDVSHCLLERGFARCFADPITPSILKEVVLDRTTQDDGACACIGEGCPLLERLSLCGCTDVSDGGVLTLLSGCSRLNDLRVSQTSVSGVCFVDQSAPSQSDVAVVVRRPSLTTLDLGDCPLHEFSVRWVAAACSSLRRLRVCGSRVDDQGLLPLSASSAPQRLEALDLSGCSQIGLDQGRALSALLRRHALTLRHIDVRETKVGMACLRTCFELRLDSLRIDAVHAASDALFGGPARAAVALNSATRGLSQSSFECTADMGPMVSISDDAEKERKLERRKYRASFRASLDEPPMHNRPLALEILTVARCPRFDASCLSWLAPKLKDLRVFDGSEAEACHTDASVWCLAKHCRQLKVLLLGRAQPRDDGLVLSSSSGAFLTDAAIHSIGEHLRHLERLDVSYHAFITGLGWQNWPGNHPYLRCLKMRGCTALTGKGLQCVVRAAPSLIDVDLEGCSLVTDMTVLASQRYAIASKHGIEPASDAAAVEARDAYYARLHLEHRSQIWVCCGWRLKWFFQRCKRRAAGAVIKRNICIYHERVKDRFRLRFKHLVTYKRILMRFSAMRIQSYVRRRKARYLYNSAARIQRFYRSRKNEWLQTFLLLVNASQKLVAKVYRGYKSRKELPLSVLRMLKLHERELESQKNLTATQIRREDQHFAHIVSQIRGHVDGLKGDLRRHFVDHADESREERNARIMREKPARFDGEDEISLPLSRKRRVPVYGNSRAASFNEQAARAGNPHVFGEPVWPEPPPKKFGEVISDFDPAAAGYEAQALAVERAAQAAMSGGAAVHIGGAGSVDMSGVQGDEVERRRLPWASGSLDGPDSLLPTLRAARLAQKKQALILDKSRSDTEARQLEEKKRLAAALEEAEEEARLAEEAALLVSEDESDAATLISAMIRGMWARVEADKLRATYERDVEARENRRIFRAASQIQKRYRANSVRTHCDKHDIGIGTCCGAREVTEEDYSMVEFGGDVQTVTRRGRGRFAPGSDGEKSVKIKIQQRVDHDFANRRIFERSRIIEEQGVTRRTVRERDAEGLERSEARLERLDEDLEYLRDVEAANEAVGKALQKRIVAFVQDAVEQNKDDKNPPAEWDLAMRGIKVRQKHLQYAIDAVDKALWWGEEALRCHYRRHKASQLFSRQCDKKQDWLYDEAHYCRQLRSVMEDRLAKAPRTVAQRYYVSWLEDQLRRLKEQYVALDSEQEHTLHKEAKQLHELLEADASTTAVLDELITGLIADYKLDAEKCGLELKRLEKDPESPDALELLRQITALKQKQELLHKGPFLASQRALESLQAAEDARLEGSVAFRGDESGISRERLEHIQCVLRNPRKVPSHLDAAKWMDIFRSQPWLVQQDVDEQKRKELYDQKLAKLKQMAAIVENKREDLARDAARLERLEKKMADHEQLRDSEDADVTEEQRADARNYVATNSGVLDDKRADFHRRKESLEKLEKQLADYQALLEEEDREATERLESARLAKAEFEEREGAEEDARAAELQTKKKALVKELGEVDLQIVQHEDEGLATDELETKKSELEEAIAKVDTELRQMRERAERRAQLAQFNEGELEREKAAKAKKALQEKLRADKKAEIMDRMRRKQQAAEEQREKDEVEAQKRREVEAEKQAASGLAKMGLVDPSLRKKEHGPKAAAKKAQRLYNSVVHGVPDKKAEQQETSNMTQSIMRRQKMKMGTCSALRKIAFTVGKEETDQFQRQQDELAEHSLPHLLRVKKTVGLHEMVVIWYEPSSDQDEFLTELQLAHPALDHQHYKNLAEKNYRQYTHDALLPTAPAQPGLVMWGRKRSDAVMVVAAVEVTYNLQDERELAADGFEKLPENLLDLGFGDMFIWIKKINRNLETNVENEETILNELKAARKELKKREDDPILLDKIKALKLRLEKVKQESDFRDEYKDDPLKFAIEFAAIGQAEIEGWLSYFEDMDVNELGAVRSRRVVVSSLPCHDLTMPGVVSLSSLSCFGPRRGRRGAVASMASSRDAIVVIPRESPWSSGRRRRDATSMLRAGVLQGGARLPRLPRLEVHARGLPAVGRALGRVAHGLRRDGEVHRAVLHVRQGRTPPLRLPDLRRRRQRLDLARGVHIVTVGLTPLHQQGKDHKSSKGDRSARRRQARVRGVPGAEPALPELILSGRGSAR